MRQLYFKHNVTVHDVKLEYKDEELKIITLDGVEHNISFRKLQNQEFEVFYNKDKHRVLVKKEGKKHHLWIDGESIILEQAERSVTTEKRASQRIIIAPIPGILHLKVKDGEQVNQDQVVAIIESMKMQNEILAPHAGMISLLCQTTVEMINAGEKLMEIIQD